MQPTPKISLGKIVSMATMGRVRVPFSSGAWMAFVWLASGGVQTMEGAEVEGRYSARLALSEIVYGGRSIPVINEVQDNTVVEVSYPRISLLPNEFPLNLGLKTAAPGKPHVVRIRTRLEGWEDEWRDHEGQMYLVLRFLDAENRAVSSESFIRRGSSPGWSGLPENSRWHRQVDEAVVPERSTRVQILLVSGGTPRTTGFWAVRQLQLSVKAAEDETTAGTEIYRLERLRGLGLDSPRGSPDSWSRDGTGLDVPTLYTNTEDIGSSGPMLALVDTDPDNTGGWLQRPGATARVVPGHRLRLDVEEKFSIGRGYETELSFHMLPAGNYMFRAWATDELGRPTGPTLRLPVEVRPPFYATGWFRLLGAGLLFGALLGGVRYSSWRRMQRELQRLEKRRAVEEERTRLARDLHDEMGSRFTQISLLAGRALHSAPSDESVQEPIRNINGAVKELASALEEIVWAANPKHDTLEGFGNYLAQYAGTVLRDAGLRCRLDIPTALPERSLPSGVRHRLMMAVKEALNNALKHAEADEVWVRLELDGECLVVTVVDNGAGFDPERVRRGNGLEHMKKRMADIGGTCGLKSRPAEGTTIRLALPLPEPTEAL